MTIPNLAHNNLSHQAHVKSDIMFRGAGFSSMLCHLLEAHFISQLCLGCNIVMVVSGS